MSIEIKLKKEYFKNLIFELNKKWAGFLFSLALGLGIYSLSQNGNLSNLILLILILFSAFCIFVWRKGALKVISLIFLMLISIKGIYGLINPYLFLIIDNYRLLTPIETYILNDFLLITLSVVSFLLFLKTFSVRTKEKNEYAKRVYNFDKSVLRSLLVYVYIAIMVLGLGYLIAGYPVKPYEKIIQLFVILILNWTLILYKGKSL